MSRIDIPSIMKDLNLPVTAIQHVCKVNTHIHTPYSFSAFNSVQEAVDQAAKEKIDVLGINDFYTVEGYKEFFLETGKRRIYPIFSIEFTGLIKEFQKNDIRLNDPFNPGRIYLCGKGLSYPVVNIHFIQYLKRLQERNNSHVLEMIKKANFFFLSNRIPVSLNYDNLFKQYARDILRERHIARAIKEEVFAIKSSDEERALLLKEIFGNVPPESALSDESALENEIRNRLLKKDKPAFVAEGSNAFYPLEELCDNIRLAGGIPCYPTLLADKPAMCNEFERDMENMHQFLSSHHIRCIEFITPRNTLEMLTGYITFFHDRKYLILFGTEHNTPEKSPMGISCKYNRQMPGELLKISYESTCVIAAHQFLMEKKGTGYLDELGVPRMDAMDDFIQLGHAVIQSCINI
jgi:hypothetical protein